MSVKLHTNYIALADILANGVVVLLILIILSLSTKQQDLEKELQQINEIGSMMSREIASSLISNALPSSTPATLHDYNHPRRTNTPRIVMHKNYLLIESAGDGKMLNLRLSKAELLQQNNHFDDFLQQLTTQQKNGIRFDIIHIKNYYLVMSIIKQHKVRVRDWHFAGNEKAVGSGNYLLFENEGEAFANQPLDEATELPPELLEKQGILTQSVDFFTGGVSSGDGVPDGVADSFNGEVFDFGQGFSLNAQSMRAEMSRRLAKLSGHENNHFIKSLNINFAGGGQVSSDNIDIQADSKEQSVGKNKMPVSKQLLGILLSYLADKQRRYQANEFVEISNDDFLNARFYDVYHDYSAEIEVLYQSISAINSEYISINHQQTQSSGLIMKVNQPLKDAKIITQKGISLSLLTDNKLSIKLYPQPTINQGLRVDIAATDVVLFAHKHNKNTDFDWQLIAVLDAQLSDVKIGFVSAKYTDDGLLLNAQENDIRLNQSAIKRYYLTNNYIRYWKWGLLVLILLIFFQLLYRRHYAESNVA